MKNISLKRIDDVCIISILNERATLNISEELNTVIIDCAPTCLDTIIDLSRCNFIDSTFIGNLISVSKKLKESKTNLFLIKPEEEAFQIIVRMGVKEVFNFLDSPADLLRRK